MAGASSRAKLLVEAAIGLPITKNTPENVHKERNLTNTGGELRFAPNPQDRCISYENIGPSTSRDDTSQLQIVEVTPFSNTDNDDDDDDDEYVDTVHMEAEPGGCNYVQVFDVHGEQVVQLDLMNLTLVKCNKDDNEATYKLVTEEMPDDDKVYDENNTFVLETDTDNAENRDPTTSKYMVLMDDPGESSLFNITPPVKKNKQKKSTEKKPKTVAELLEKKKALEKAKKLLNRTMKRSNRGRPATLPLPRPDEMLSSPNFKLYLYQCKICSFKCNAAKELTQHKRTEHFGKRSSSTHTTSDTKSTESTGLNKKPVYMYECTKCHYKGNSSVQLMRHIQENHLKYDIRIEGSDPETLEVIDSQTLQQIDTETLTLDQETLDQETLDQEALDETLEDIFECGACGYQTVCTETFREHAALVHHANVTLTEAEFT